MTKGLSYEASFSGGARYTIYTGTVRVLGSIVRANLVAGHVEQRLADENIGHDAVLLDMQFPERLVFEEDIEYPIGIDFIVYTRQDS